MRYITEDGIVAIKCSCDECDGMKDLCITDIKLIVEDGGIAYVMYSEHVKEKVEMLGYHIKVFERNDVPIGMYLMKDGNISML